MNAPLLIPGLPNEVAKPIVADPALWMKSVLVNKAWRAVAFSNVVLLNASKRGYLYSVEVEVRGLSAVYVSNCVPESALIALTHANNIQHLTIENEREDMEEGLILQLLQNSPNATKVSLCSAFITDNTIEKLIHNCKRLQELYIEGEITVNGITALVHANLSHLKKLCIGTDKSDNAAFLLLTQLTTNCQQLQSLKVFNPFNLQASLHDGPRITYTKEFDDSMTKGGFLLDRYGWYHKRTPVNEKYLQGQQQEVQRHQERLRLDLRNQNYSPNYFGGQHYQQQQSRQLQQYHPRHYQPQRQQQSHAYQYQQQPQGYHNQQQQQQQQAVPTQQMDTLMVVAMTNRMIIML